MFYVTYTCRFWVQSTNFASIETDVRAQYTALRYIVLDEDEHTLYSYHRHHHYLYYSIFCVKTYASDMARNRNGNKATHIYKTGWSAEWKRKLSLVKHTDILYEQMRWNRKERNIMCMIWYIYITLYTTLYAMTIRVKPADVYQPIQLFWLYRRRESPCRTFAIHRYHSIIRLSSPVFKKAGHFRKILAKNRIGQMKCRAFLRDRWDDSMILYLKRKKLRQ